MTTRTTTSRCVAALAGVTIVTGLLGMHSKQAMAADSWPTRPVKILVPFAAGGNTDVIARLTADRLMNAIKDSSFLVENQPGGGGVTVTTQVARAAPDGNTLLMAASPQLVIAPAIQSVKFDPAKDFTPIKIITNNPVVLMAHKSLPAEDVPGLLVHVRAIGPKFSSASGSLGSLSHLASALLFNKAGLEATPVHYRGGAPAMNDVLAGHLPMMFANLSEVLAQSGNADIKLLAVSSARRVLHAADATGREISRVLWQHVSALPTVRVVDDARAVHLTLAQGACVGVRYVHGTSVIDVRAAATLLATGGAGRVFRETTNPPVATGDGVTLAWQAGAAVSDLEFVQFHPTVMAVPGTARFLLSEALRGDGAWLLNAHGERFMTRYEAAGELASRDLVARAIVREEVRTGGPVTLSLRHLDAEWVRRRFPTIAAACRERGLDLATDAVPVSPAAHYIMGGVATDIETRTTVPGLYAAGEVACTGVHGANRLASNSLLEGLVFGGRAAVAMCEPPRRGAVDRVRTRGLMPAATAATVVPEADAVRELMWREVGLVREASGLARAVVTLDGWRRAAQAGDPAGGSAIVSLTTVAWLIARAALDRRESRGGHARSDFPARDDLHFKVHVTESIHDQDF